MKKKYLLVFGLLAIFAYTSLVFQSCGKKERKLDNLQEQLVKAGYSGDYNKAGKMERTALGVFGVKDRLVFTGTKLNAVFIEFDKKRNFNEIANKVLPIILENANQEEKDMIKSAEENIYTNDNLIMIVDRADEKLIKLFMNY